MLMTRMHVVLSSVLMVSFLLLFKSGAGANVPCGCDLSAHFCDAA